MGFHKKYISNEQVVQLFSNGGVDNIREWYLGKADALMTESGLASSISSILAKQDTLRSNQDNEISILLQKHFSVDDIKNKTS